MTLLHKTSKEKNEFLVLLYRLLLIMAFYSAFRAIFYLFNASFFPNVQLSNLLTIFKGGLMFDLSAMLYLNLLYVFFYILPLPFKFSSAYQRFLKIMFITFNGLGFALNSIDIIYYRFILKRTTYNVFNILENETNMGKLWGQFIIDYWYIALLFVALLYALHRLYSLIQPRKVRISNRWLYSLVSLVALVLFSGFSIIGMRGGYRHSTRPINMANAGKYVNSPDEMAIVLNTPFCVIRTWGKTSFTAYDYFKSEDELSDIYEPIIEPDKYSVKQKKNVVVFILESFNREYIGSLNQHLDSGRYTGYTPFLDSLIEHSLVFPNAFASGTKSIDAMPSVLASIPALVLPYVVSEYSSNKINAFPSLLKKDGYSTAFFHGAHNGSMGFDSFAKVAGFDQYYGLEEYDNADDFDGMWGIWDEPFFQFYAEKMNQMKEPFMTSLFSVSSHHPFKVPEQYTDAFPKGTLPVHQCVGYTDHALRQFFETAKTMPWYKNTLFVFTADHSSESQFPISKTTVNKFQIPLIFFNPGDSAFKGIDYNLAQQIDIMPTVLQYLGFDQPYVAFGNDLLNCNSDRFCINYTNESYQLAVNNYVIHYDGQDIISAFNMANDPLLKENIKDTDNGYRVHLPLMQAIIQQYNNRMIEDRLIIK